MLSLVIEMRAPLQDMKVSNKYYPWLNSDYKNLSRQRDKIKTASVKHKSAILMDAYRKLQNKTNVLNKILNENILPRNWLPVSAT